MKVYLDNHATTMVDPEVLEAMMPYLTNEYGNAASRTHYFGWNAANSVTSSRNLIANTINAFSPEEIIFTSGATEANNLAIIGSARAYKKLTGRNEIIVSEIEHSSILDSAKYLESEGFIVKYAKVYNSGLLRLDDLNDCITEKTILISCMAANNEIGTIQDISAIGKLCREKEVLFHCDAAQAFGQISIDVQKFNIDLLTATAHKIHGPKGTGFLFIRQFKPRCKIEPLIYGGGHENGFRSGTLNVAGIVGLAKATELINKTATHQLSAIARLRDKLLNTLRSELDHIHINGTIEHRLANNLNIAFEFIEGEALLTYLNQFGIAVTSGAACSSLKKEPSHVLKAIRVRDDLIHSSVRFGLSRFTTEAEIDYTIKTVINGVTQLRKLSPLYDKE